VAEPYYADDHVTLWHGDCLDVLRELPDASVDSVVTDPPYALEFMGSTWDGWSSPKAFQEWCGLWATECLRVLKPGGHMVAFGGSRTWHRLAAAVEDAGFEIRDSIAWLHGQGFPKSLDVSKAIDKVRDDRSAILRVTGWLAEQRDRAGWTNRQIDEAFGFNGMAGHWTAAPRLKVAQVPRWEQWERLRDLIGFGDEMDAEVWRLNGRKGTPGEAWQTAAVVGERSTGRGTGRGAVSVIDDGDRAIRAANSDAARRWQGWGTALKPAFEPIVVGRKPLAGTVAANVLAHGTGALNIDGCRVQTYDDTGRTRNTALGVMNDDGWKPRRQESESHVAGRWPANVVLDDTQAPELDRQSGTLTSGANPTRRGSDKFREAYGEFAGQEECTPARGADSGGASRFFPTFRYEAKATTAERPRVGEVAHPTVKPLDLMRWLVRLVTPPGGTVLEPFAGSGTTAEACVVEGFRCIAIEREFDYLALIVARLTKPIEMVLDFGEAS
jgi:DNA modification methylase